MNLEDIMLNEIRQSQEGHVPCDSTYTRDPEESNSERREAKWRLRKAAGRRTGRFVVNGDRVSIWEDEKFWRLGRRGDSCTTT